MLTSKKVEIDFKSEILILFFRNLDLQNSRLHRKRVAIPKKIGLWLKLALFWSTWNIQMIIVQMQNLFSHFSINFHNWSYSKLSLEKLYWWHSIIWLSPNDQTLDPASHLVHTCLILVNSPPSSLNVHKFLSTPAHPFKKPVNHMIL